MHCMCPNLHPLLGPKGEEVEKGKKMSVSHATPSGPWGSYGKIGSAPSLDVAGVLRCPRPPPLLLPQHCQGGTCEHRVMTKDQWESPVFQGAGRPSPTAWSTAGGFLWGSVSSRPTSALGARLGSGQGCWKTQRSGRGDPPCQGSQFLSLQLWYPFTQCIWVLQIPFHGRQLLCTSAISPGLGALG
jgi:hypothetical protein